MRYSIGPRGRRYVKGYGFLSFPINIGTCATKNISIKYSQKLADIGRKSGTDAIKTASNRGIQKTAEATGDLAGNKIADNITSTLKKSLRKPHNEELSLNEVNKEIPKERYISPKERQQIIAELR